MTREEYEKQYDAIDIYDNDDSGSISMYARRAHASNMRVNVCQDYISSLEAEVEEYKAELDRVLEAHKKAVARLNEWSPELAQDFVTLLLMDLQKKEEK